MHRCPKIHFKAVLLPQPCSYFAIYVEDRARRTTAKSPHTSLSILTTGPGKLFHEDSVADPGVNLTGALHSNFGHCGCGGRG